MGKGGWDLASLDYWKIRLHVVTGDMTDTDVELVSEEGHNRIMFRKHMSGNSNFT